MHMWQKDQDRRKKGGTIEVEARDPVGLEGVTTPLLAGTSPAVTPGGVPPAGTDATVSSDAGEWRPLFRFEGRGGDYFRLLVKTFILSLFTLGIYSFWGRTEQRRYLWSRTALLGEPLEYTGKGKELFVSFLIVLPVFLVLMLLWGMLSRVAPLLGWLPPLLLLYAWQFASYRTLRFRLTRTRWRGLRGNMSGSALSYAAKATVYILLIGISLGLLFPWARARMAALKMNNILFGDRKISFSGPARELFPVFYPALFGIIALAIVAFTLTNPLSREYGLPYDAFELGLASFPLLQQGIRICAFLAVPLALFVAVSFYQAAFFRWLCGHARFGEMEIRSTLSGSRQTGVSVANGLTLTFSLGLGLAWCVTRTGRAWLNSVEYKGDPQIAALQEDTREAPATGEGLLDLLDLGVLF